MALVSVLSGAVALAAPLKLYGAGTMFDAPTQQSVLFFNNKLLYGSQTIIGIDARGVFSKHVGLISLVYCLGQSGFPGGAEPGKCRANDNPR